MASGKEWLPLHDIPGVKLDEDRTVATIEYDSEYTKRTHKVVVQVERPHIQSARKPRNAPYYPLDHVESFQYIRDLRGLKDGEVGVMNIHEGVKELTDDLYGYLMVAWRTSERTFGLVPGKNRVHTLEYVDIANESKDTE